MAYQPLNISLSGAKPLAPTTASNPFSGVMNSLSNIFKPSPGLSLTGGASAKPLLPSVPSYQPTGMVTSLSPQVSLPTLPSIPSLSSQVRPMQSIATPSLSLGIPKASAQTVPTQNNYSGQLNPNQDVSSIPALSGMSTQLSNISQTINSLTPRNFTTNTGTTPNVYDANKLSPGALKDLENIRQAKENALNTGKNPDGTPANGLVPSDSLLGNYVNKLYQSSLYSPQEISAIQSYNDATATLNAEKLANIRKVQDMTDNGAISKEQAQPMIEDINRRYGYDQAYAASQQASSALSMDVYARQRGNTVEALKNIGGFMSPTQVSPGSTLYSPLAGTMYQGMGAAPATVMATAQQLEQTDMANGTLQYNPDGTVNHNAYIQQAQQYYGGGQIGNQIGGSVSSGYDSGYGMALPPALQKYVVNTTDGATYINDTLVPAAQKNVVQQQAAAAGIKYLSANDVGALQSIQYADTNMDKLAAVVDQTLKPGVTGRITNTISAKLNDLFQNNQQLVAFNQARDTAIKTIQGLAGGPGSGFRLNQSEIDTATGNLPSASDNLETAKTKISWVKGFLADKKSLLLTGNVANQSSGSNIIQTKVGAVDNSWF